MLFKNTEFCIISDGWRSHIDYWCIKFQVINSMIIFFRVYYSTPNLCPTPSPLSPSSKPPKNFPSYCFVLSHLPQKKSYPLFSVSLPSVLMQPRRGFRDSVPVFGPSGHAPRLPTTLVHDAITCAIEIDRPIVLSPSSHRFCDRLQLHISFHSSIPPPRMIQRDIWHLQPDTTVPIFYSILSNIPAPYVIYRFVASSPSDPTPPVYYICSRSRCKTWSLNFNTTSLTGSNQ